MQRWRVTGAVWVASLLVVVACSTGSGGTQAATTTVPSRWPECRTRLDFDRVVLGVADPDPAVRADALTRAESIPQPTGLEQPWITLVGMLRRYVDLAARVQETDPDAFRAAVDQLAEQDAAMSSLRALTSEDEQRRIGQLRVEGPCDAVGLADDFGCPEPQQCTQMWIEAVERGDDVALSALGSVWLRPYGATVVGAQVGSCDEAQDRPGVQRCTFTGAGVEGSVDWSTTTDGRWYGVDAEMSSSTPADTEPAGP